MKIPRVRGFYSKYLLIFILLICIITIGLSVLIGELAAGYERTEFLHKYDMALTDLSRVFYLKQKYFYNELTPLFSEVENYNVLCDLLKAPSPESLSPASAQNAVRAVAEIAERNLNCAGVLLYSSVHDALYLYDTRYRTIDPISLQADFPLTDSFAPEVLGSPSLRLISRELAGMSNHLYGLVGTLSEHSSRRVNILGKIVVLYQTGELIEPLNSYNFVPGTSFSIVTAKGEAIFHSMGDYEQITLADPPQIAASSEAFFTPTKKITDDQGDWYVASIDNGRYDYRVSYQIPVSPTQGSYIRGLIFLLSVTISLISVGLYLATFLQAHRKVRSIEKGMARIGRNDLTYRIPSPRGQDEFSQIIDGFNRMGKALQENVERSYIYELQQKKAELYALQTSMNPHFLYNTLEMIRVQINRGRSSGASQMVLLLSKIYRAQASRQMYVSIAEEIELCENVIYLYQYRFDNFEYSVHADPAVLSYGLPKNTLQPLIENFFVHGLDAERDDNYLSLEGGFIERDGQRFVRLTFRNNGRVMPAEELAALNERLRASIFDNQQDHGFALANINSRLRIVFGENSGVYPGVNNQGEGFMVELIFPPVYPGQLERFSSPEANVQE